MTGPDVVQVTYREIAERFGIGIEGARLKAKRRAAKGEWRIIPGNHPQDIVRVEMPANEFRAGPNKPPRTPPHAQNEGGATDPPQQEPQRRDTNDLEALVEVVSQLTAQSQAMTERLIEAERGRAEAERDTGIVRVEMKAIEAQLIAAQEKHVAALKALQERMAAETGQAQADLAAWKARPWWRRIAG
jgi:DNA repair exonuclease SbcCD ATPase subunit